MQLSTRIVPLFRVYNQYVLYKGREVTEAAEYWKPDGIGNEHVGTIRVPSSPHGRGLPVCRRETGLP